MIATLALLTALQADVTPKPSELISKMVAHYSEATTIAGNIKMVQTAEKSSVTVNSTLQAERPSKLYLAQTSNDLSPNEWLVNSSGVRFGYHIPNYMSLPNARSRKRLYEDVTLPNGRILTINDIFIAAKKSLGDAVCPFLEICLPTKGNNDSLRAYMMRLSQLKISKLKVPNEGPSYYIVSGVFQFGANVDGRTTQKDITAADELDHKAPIEFYITTDFDLRQVRVVDTYSFTMDAQKPPKVIEVITTWEGNLQLNKPVNPNLFSGK